MEPKCLRESDLIVDLERGSNSIIDIGTGDGPTKKVVSRGEELRSSGYHFSSNPESSESNGEASSEEKVGFLEKKAGPNSKRLKKKGEKKPPRPPRPPKALSLDASDQKLIREISEFATLKRARMERMKALKKMKNDKATAPSGNLFALIITVIFCVVIIWQGVFCKGSPSVVSQHSSGSTTGSRSGFISVQLYKDASTFSSGSLSPKNSERVSGMDEQREKQASRVAM